MQVSNSALSAEGCGLVAIDDAELLRRASSVLKDYENSIISFSTYFDSWGEKEAAGKEVKDWEKKRKGLVRGIKMELLEKMVRKTWQRIWK